MRCRAAPRGLRAGRLHQQRRLQTAPWSARARRARARRASPFIHCASIGTRKRLPARSTAGPRRAIAPASQGAALAGSTLGGGVSRRASGGIHALFVAKDGVARISRPSGCETLATLEKRARLSGSLLALCRSVCTDNHLEFSIYHCAKVRNEFCSLRHRCDEITACVSHSCCWQPCSQPQRWS